ncbi:Leishmanolysin peptidase [Fasciola gigantica]|uniref:Leishmanolysin-like peptidase n=1 Tax=Fasciola gigantica TaxID=46835 RepID=A0A504YXA8_FASGI|nr:Leishmanolysin peptidase [Fasciola gigantica]
MARQIFTLWVLKSIVHLIFGEHICWTPPNNTMIFYHSSNLMLARSTTLNSLRIKAYYTDLFKSLSSYNDLVTNAIEPALDYWRKMLRPKNPLTENFYASRFCVDGESVLQTDADGIRRSYCVKGCQEKTYCYTQEIPDDFLDYCREMVNGQPKLTGTRGAGMADTDFLVIVDAVSVTECSTGLLAFATTCQIDNQINRPILGFVNVCPKSLKLTYPEKEITKYTLLHELAHSLGFSPLLYAFMRDENGNPRTKRDPSTDLPDLGQDAYSIFIPSNSTVDTITRTWVSAVTQSTRTVKILKTPNVLVRNKISFQAAAREHFACSTLEGVELENQGGAGTSSAHFEKHIVQDELMAGSIGKSLFVSNLTLSYFQDTGWYDVDRTLADNWLWGKGLGCDFVRKSCYEYWKIKESAGLSIEPWCKKVYSKDTYCLSYDNAYGSCDLVKYSTALPLEYQYFTSLPGISSSAVPNYGSSNILGDFCPSLMLHMAVLNSQHSRTMKSYPSSIDSVFSELFWSNGWNRKSANYELESYGMDSTCFNHDPNAPWNIYQCTSYLTRPAVEATCHKVSINPRNRNTNKRIVE